MPPVFTNITPPLIVQIAPIPTSVLEGPVG